MAIPTSLIPMTLGLSATLLTPRHLGAALLGFAVSSSCGGSRNVAAPDGQLPSGVTVTTLAGGFDTIWDLAWSPDNTIWVTERPGTISRVNPSTGAITRIGTIPVSENGEGGLMGLALHPDFANGQPYIYVSHTYSANGTRNRVLKIPVNGNSLGTPQVMIDNLPGSSIHNGSRLAIGPDRLLYITIGDASNTGLPQDRNALGGKILRLTLDGAPAPGNPFGNAVFSYGHRNPQGLVFLPTGALYATEHGPSDNDEVNRIEAGRNFGWPDVHGMCDNDTGSGERAFCQANNVVEPLVTWTPTIAPAGIDYYDKSAIAQWKGSLLFTTLKGTALYRLTLSSDGRSVTSQERLFEGQYGRLRDVLVGPDGAVYVGTSNRDGRGSPQGEDDRILRIRPQ